MQLSSRLTKALGCRRFLRRARLWGRLGLGMIMKRLRPLAASAQHQVQVAVTVEVSKARRNRRASPSEHREHTIVSERSVAAPVSNGDRPGAHDHEIRI